MSLISFNDQIEEKASQKEEIAIGIDLGTTNSLIAFSDERKPKLLHKSIKSTINLNAKGDFIIGEENQNSLRSVKRLMGKTLSDLDETLLKYNYNFISDKTDHKIITLNIGGKKITPIEASAEILKHLKLKAEAALKTDISKAVITVPAYFDDAARQATKDAASLAGLEVLRLINEPTAAACMYGLDNEKEGYYAVYDFGGGTFDVSILKMEKGVFKVIATKGDNFLGGDDIDILIAKHKNIDIESAKKLKEEKSSDFNKLIEPIIQKTLDIFSDTIKDAKLKFSDLEEIILVGGSTKIEAVKRKLQTLTGQKPLDSIDPDTIVANGAALQAENLTKGTGNLLVDIIPLSLSLETMGGIVEKIIPRNSHVPISASQSFTTFKDNQTGMQIHITQGERELASENRSLAFFELKNIPAMPAGKAKIKIDFNIDADGILTVSALEESTGQKQEVQVKPSYGLSISDMQGMLEESMKNAKTDMQKIIFAKNCVEIDCLVDNIQKTINDSDYPVDEQTKTNAQKRCEQALKSSKELQKENKFLEVDKLQKDLKEFLNQLALKKVEIITEALKGKNLEDINNLFKSNSK